MNTTDTELKQQVLAAMSFLKANGEHTPVLQHLEGVLGVMSDRFNMQPGLLERLLDELDSEGKLRKVVGDRGWTTYKLPRQTSTNPITVYYSETRPTSREDSPDDEEWEGWYWCVAGFDPAGPYDTREEAITSLYETLVTKEHCP